MNATKKRFFPFTSLELTFFLALFFAGLMLQAQNHRIKITVKKITSPSGSLQIALFDSTGFITKEKPVKSAGITLNDTAAHTIIFKNIPGGRYAIAVFQDTNGNKLLDRRQFGIPAEPYGFSGDFNKKRPPRFEETAFSLHSDSSFIIYLINPPEKRKR